MILLCEPNGLKIISQNFTRSPCHPGDVYKISPVQRHNIRSTLRGSCLVTMSAKQSAITEECTGGVGCSFNVEILLMSPKRRVTNKINAHANPCCWENA